MATNMSENQRFKKNEISNKQNVVYHIFKHEEYNGATSSL